MYSLHCLGVLFEPSVLQAEAMDGPFLPCPDDLFLAMRKHTCCCCTYQEHLTAAQAMKVARRELQAADRDRDGILNRDETFKYFYGTLCIKFLSRKVVKSRSEVRAIFVYGCLGSLCVPLT